MKSHSCRNCEKVKNYHGKCARCAPCWKNKLFDPSKCEACVRIFTIANKTGKSVEEVIQTMKNAAPAKRYAQPEEEANAIVLLSSERARFINGIKLIEFLDRM